MRRQFRRQNALVPAQRLENLIPSLCIEHNVSSCTIFLDWPEKAVLSCAFLHDSATRINRMLYFAYGSNLNARAVTEWCRHHGHRPITLQGGRPGVLDNYRLGFPIYSEYW